MKNYEFLICYNLVAKQIKKQQQPPKQNQKKPKTKKKPPKKVIYNKKCFFSVAFGDRMTIRQG